MFPTERSSGQFDGSSTSQYNGQRMTMVHVRHIPHHGWCLSHLSAKEEELRAAGKRRNGV